MSRRDGSWQRQRRTAAAGQNHDRRAGRGYRKFESAKAGGSEVGTAAACGRPSDLEASLAEAGLAQKRGGRGGLNSACRGGGDLPVEFGRLGSPGEGEAGRRPAAALTEAVLKGGSAAEAVIWSHSGGGRRFKGPGPARLCNADTPAEER